MSDRPKEMVLTVEGELYVSEDIAPLKLRLSTTLTAVNGGTVSDTDVEAATESLKSTLLVTLKGLGGGEPAPRPAVQREGPPRALDLLREIYTPRSMDHLDALLWEGEISKEEHTVLAASMRSGGATPTQVPRMAKTVEELVKEFDLRNMGDANRARGKRLISYDEWAALKHHFSKSPQVHP